MINKELVNKKDIVKLYKEYINNGGELSPFNTEPCRKYLQEKIQDRVEAEDVLWLFYNIKM